MRLYEDSLNPLQKGKFKTYMEKLVRWEEQVTDQLTYLCSKYDMGYTEPIVEEDVIGYKRNGEMKKPTTERYLHNPETGYSLPCTKTDFDFLSFIKQEGYKGADYLAFVEQRRQEELEKQQQEKERELQERERKAQRDKIEREERKKKYAEGLKQETEAGKTLFFKNTELMTHLVVTLKKLEPFLDDFHKRTSQRDEPVEQYMKEYKENIKDLIYRMYGNPERYVDTLKLAFEEGEDTTRTESVILQTFFKPLVNLTPEDSKQTVHAKIKACLEQRQYKGSVKREVETSEVWVYTAGGRYEKENLEIVTIKGKQLALKGKTGDYRYIDIFTGLVVVSAESKTELKQKIDDLPNNFFTKEGYVNIISRSMRKMGVSPFICSVKDSRNFETIKVQVGGKPMEAKGFTLQKESVVWHVIAYEDMFAVFEEGVFKCITCTLQEINDLLQNVADIRNRKE